MPESGFGWWHLTAVTSHSQAFLQSTKMSSLTNCLPQWLAKGCAPAGRPSAPGKLQQRLLISTLKDCSAFTHIHLILGQSSPPTAPPQTTHNDTSLLQKGLCTFSFASMTLRGNGYCGHQGYLSAYSHKHAGAFAGALVPSCQLLQIKRLLMEMKNGTYDFLMGTL